MSLPRQLQRRTTIPRHMGHRDAAIGLYDLDEARIVSLAPDVSLTQVGSSVMPIPALGKFYLERASELTTKPCLDF